MRDTKAVKVRAEVSINLDVGAAKFISFENLKDDKEHIAIKFGEPELLSSPLVRLHSECLTGDVFGSMHCDCGEQLKESVEAISSCGGYVIYLRQEGRGIGLYSKLDAYKLQAEGLDTFEANMRLNFLEDYREYSVAAEMLKSLGADKITLITNNPEKVAQIRSSGIEVSEVLSTNRYANRYNSRYLEAKEKRSKHVFGKMSEVAK